MRKSLGGEGPGATAISVARCRLVSEHYSTSCPAALARFSGCLHGAATMWRRADRFQCVCRQVSSDHRVRSHPPRKRRAQTATPPTPKPRVEAATPVPAPWCERRRMRCSCRRHRHRWFASFQSLDTNYLLRRPGASRLRMCRSPRACLWMSPLKRFRFLLEPEWICFPKMGVAHRCCSHRSREI